MRRFSFAPDAEAELEEAAHYYDARAAGLGQAFLEEVRSAVEAVLSHPEAAPVVRGTIRCKTIRRFPYNLLYSIEPDRIRIHVVMHKRRRPGYWIDRL